MIETIKKFKIDYLNRLKAEKTAVEETKKTLVSEKYAAKKVANEVACKELDEALALWVQAKQQALNEEIAAKRKEVADKKVALDNKALAEAENETGAEISIQITEYANEIQRIENELSEG